VTREFQKFEERLGYQFNDRHLLLNALTHRSYANEKAGKKSKDNLEDNEKLEFLGDAVLDLVVGHMLMNRFPDAREGQLSVTRSQVVSEAGLVEVARDLSLGSWLLLGKGENLSGGKNKASILSDALEAVVAAVYLDGGYEAAWSLVDKLFSLRISEITLNSVVDFKTRFQERSQAVFKETPIYKVLQERGPDHAKTFEVVVFIEGKEWGRGQGKSKKEAEQGAAQNGLLSLDKTHEE